MVKKYLLKADSSVKIDGDEVTFLVTEGGGRVMVCLDLGELPISNITGVGVSTGAYITLGVDRTIDAANAILKRLGAKGKVVADLETVLGQIEYYGRSFDEKHRYFIDLYYEDGKVSGVEYYLTDGRCISFGTKFYTEEVAKKLCILIEETLEAENETANETADGSKVE